MLKINKNFIPAEPEENIDTETQKSFEWAFDYSLFNEDILTDLEELVNIRKKILSDN